MHLTFAQAYALVCPEGGPVVPHSKEYTDIMELMRQSGHVPVEERLVIERVPKVPTSVQQALPYIERAVATLPTDKVSKRQWLSIDVNRETFLKHLNMKKNNNSSLI
tara:strand:+ start:857 stop:1177 length:321 start_codon:yes stop_codon:yes gene_type:complete